MAKYSDDLLDAYVPLYQEENCKKRWGHFFWEKEISGGENQTGAGPEDSGGPILVRLPSANEHQQIGIVSVGSSDVKELQNQADNPSVYTRALSYCDWLYENTENECQCS